MFSHGRMQKRRISANGLALLVFLTQMLFAMVASEQCEVKDIHVRTPSDTTFVYNFTYKDPSCSNKAEMKVVTMKTCPEDASYDVWDEEVPITCREEGRWKATLGDVESPCFNCPFGLNSKPHLRMRFCHKELLIKMHHVHPDVSSWNLTIYKATMPWYEIPCNNTQIEKIRDPDRFENTGLQAKISLTEITLKHDFEEACYCFVMLPINNVGLWHTYEKFTTGNCKPLSCDGNGPTPNDNMPTPTRTWVTVAVLVGIVCLVAIVLKVIHSNPQCLSKLLGLSRQMVPSKWRDNYEMILQRADVLLLHAPDVSGSDHLAELKKHLQYNFKVHDLYDRNDCGRLANLCDWMEEKLMPGSGVKLLLVESVGMMDVINSLLQSSSENTGMVKATHASCKHLILALRTIISTNLAENYSTVFVVRFSDEVKDITELLVKMKRYKFPDHILELKEDMARGRRLQDDV